MLQRAGARHPLVEAARARVAAARGARLSAGVLPNPVFTYWVENTGFPGRTAPAGLERESQAYATLPLEPLFQRWPRVGRANAEVRAADADLARARQLVALDAAHAFYRVAEAQVAVDASDDVRARLAELVTFNRARVKEGVAAEADLIRTELELDRVAAAGTLERVELARARSALAPYLSSASADPVGPEQGGGDLRVSIDDAAAEGKAGVLSPLATFVSQARVRRPDVTAARARAAAARSEVGYQRTLAVRQLGATFGSKRTGGVTSMVVGLSLPIPLFDQNRGEVQRASGERAAAEQELAWAERQATADVEAAYEATRMLTEQAAQLRGGFLSRAEESRRIALAAYQEGAVNLLQVLDAARTLADARVSYYRVLFAQRQSVLDLNAATGASVTDALAPPPSAAPIADSSTPTSSPRVTRASGDRP